MRTSLWAIAVFSLLNATLYCLLLPLWEGFDEAFHYGYVQTLSAKAELPVLGKTRLSREVLLSLHLAPASHVVRQNLPFVTTFDEFAKLPEAARIERRESLRSLPVSLADSEAQGSSNYQAQQAPLAYVPLAAVNRLLRGEPLLKRVLIIRLVAALSACMLQFVLTLTLARMLGLPPPAQAMALFLALSSQMFYAATAHIANDWLAIPLATLVVIAVLRFHRLPGWRNGVLLASAVAAGLLAKAYFLSWALFAVGAVVWMVLRRRATLSAAVVTVAAVIGLAGPWYLRNILFYHSLSGMQQSAAGIGPAQVLRAALDVPWPHALAASARGAIWTGNSSFTSFSSATVDLVLWMILAALAIWLWGSRSSPDRRPEWLVAAACLCFFGSLLYAQALFYAFTKGGDYSAAPWHTQTLAAPLACLLSLGLSRAGRAGRLLGYGLAVAAAYLISATYVVKLIPMYAGYGQGSMKAAALWNWYFADPHRWRSILSQTALGNADLILVLTAAVVIMSAVLCAVLCRQFISPRGAAR